jgi:nucleoside-diphosphate-sugar epimerase
VNVLIIGGTGFVGRAMRACAPEGASVSVYTRHEGHLQGDWTHIVHAAGSFNTGQDPTSDIAATELALRAANLSGARLLLASSGAAGESNIYGATHALKEAMCEGHTIARLFSFIDRTLPEHHAIRQFFDSASRGSDVVVTGSGDTVRSYLHSSEMARILWELLADGSPCVHEVGSAVPTTVLELARLVAGLYGVGVTVLGGDDGPRKVYKPLGGYLPRISVPEALVMEANR